MMKKSLVEALPPLLMQLAEAKANAAACRSNTRESSAVADDLFKKIEGDLVFIKNIFLRLERWERDVHNELGEIAKHLDNDDDNDNRDDNKEEFLRHKLQAVEQKVSNLKHHMTPPLQLPPAAVSSLTMPTATTAVGSSSQLDALELDTYTFARAMMEILEKKPYNMKDRMLSLSMFPENAVIKKTLLIYWWIGEGLCEDEKHGEKIVNKFIRRNLITPIYRAHCSATDSFTIPPMIRCELIRIAMKVDSYGFNYYSTHVRLFDPAAAEGNDRRYNPETVLTCINVSRRYLNFERSEFTKIGRIVVLHLGGWQLQGSSAKHQHIELHNNDFLEWLGSYFQTLRYLSLQGISRITKLPPSIGKLTNLTILDLRACYNLESLPFEITMLSNLTHLDVSGCYFINHMPKGLGLLFHLQVLKGFVIGSAKSQDPCRLEELSRLEKLRKLSINIRRDSLVEGGLRALRSFTALRALTIIWGAGISISDRGRPGQASTVNMDMMINVTPPPNLEKLDLRCFPDSTPPEWLDPSSLWTLKKLYIRGGMLQTLCDHRRDFDTLRTRWLVQVLRMRFLNELDMHENELLGEFPNLAYLEIHECNKLRSTARQLVSNKLRTTTRLFDYNSARQ